jgi:asparagine synthase (glutamine-hydrolysing)
MCGLAGELRFRGAAADCGAVERMATRLQPRGPDAVGLYAQGPLALGHRRLKIVDLSEAAQQPMVDAHLGLALAFNGMIYNYRELRAELEALGYRFFSTGDTEVVLKAWHAWGEAAVERFNGMFAFALWRRDERRLHLVRDRLGVKPLYWAETPDGLRFASTLPALLAGGGVSGEIDPVALHHYMSFHAVVPAPLTILRAVRKLEPGTTLTIEADGGRSSRRYWDLQFGPRPGDESRGPEEWRELTREALQTAVRRRRIADVPVGVLLSGGLDSSLIVGLLAGQGQEDIRTFSIGFEAVGGEAGDEFRYSDAVVQRFGTTHRRIFIGADRLLPALPDAVAAMAEPMVSHDAVAFYLLASEVSKSVKVVMSGQGADEVFAGYHWHPPMLDSADPAADYARVFCDREHQEFLEATTPRYAGEDHSRAFIARRFAEPGASRAIDKTLRLDQTVMLVDDPVKRVDNMTMAWGLEARVPFLDHELVELAARMPAELKLAQGGKGILKAAARGVVPDAVIDRPKGYFPVPALKYLRGPYLGMVEDLLGSAAARRRGVFDKRYVDKLLAEPEAHITPLRGSKLWQVGLLEMWLQSQGI